MGMRSRMAFVLALATIAAAGAAVGQGLPKQKGPARIVKMFDIFCLSQLPGLDGVAQAAGFGEFAQITGAELEQYQPAVPAEELRAWKFHEDGAEYVLTASKSKPDSQFKAEVPKFANSTNYSCSLVVPASKDKNAFFEEVVALVGRAPDETWVEGALQAHAWSGQNEKLFSNVHYFEPVETGPTRILSATTFVNE